MVWILNDWHPPLRMSALQAMNTQRLPLAKRIERGARMRAVGRQGFGRLFASPAEQSDLRFSGHRPLPWADFRLGSRRLRGGDFLTRWSQKRWAERQVAEAVLRNGRWLPIPFGPNAAASWDDPRSHAAYLERLESAGRGDLARPDLLVAARSEGGEAEGILSEVGGSSELPFLDEDDPRMRRLLDLSVLAVAPEATPARAESVVDDPEPSRSASRTAQRSGSSEKALRPAIVLEHEVMDRLASWQRVNEVPIHIWQVFFDSAFGIRLDRAREVVRSGLVESGERVFQAPDGTLVERTLYGIPRRYGYRLGRMTTEPVISADRLRDEHGQILPYIRFEGGGLELSAEANHLLSFPGNATNPA